MVAKLPQLNWGCSRKKMNAQTDTKNNQKLSFPSQKQSE